MQQFNQVIIILRDNKLVITTEPKIFHFDLPKDVGINLKQEIYIIIKYNKLLANHTIKNMETILMNTENSQTSESHNFLLTFHKE